MLHRFFQKIERTFPRVAYEDVSLEQRQKIQENKTTHQQPLWILMKMFNKIIPWVQRCFNMWKCNVKCYINRIRGKTHMIISIALERMCVKIQHSFIIETLNNK